MPQPSASPPGPDRRTVLAAAAALALGPALPCGAGEPVVLTVDGRIAAPGGAADFTRADLERVGYDVLRTSTPWHEGPVLFGGVRLSALLARVGAAGSPLVVSALNDYSAAIPWSDVRDFDPLLATRAEDRPLTVREKGPLFVIYPFDQRPAARTESVYARSVWQVRRITAK